MQKISIWAALLGVEKTTVHHVDTCPETGVLLARVRADKLLRKRWGMWSRRWWR